MKTNISHTILNLVSALVCILLFFSFSNADEVYSKNQKANRLYKQGKYDEALKLYNDAALLSPSDPALKINKGSALYKLKDYDKAEESVNGALSSENKKIKADALYNMGNILFKEGEKLQKSGDPSANDKYKAALQNYIQALDIRPEDRDAKWNLQLTHNRIKKLEQQQQQQQKQDQQKNNDKNNKDNQKNKDDQKNSENKNQDKKQDQQNQNQDKRQQQNDKKQQNEQQKDNQQQQNNEQQKQQESNQQQNNQAQQKDNQDNMKKDEAKRLIEFYADDADSLNKPKNKVGVAHPAQPQRDW
jgi:Ca-activated chloride channel family protein